MEDTDTADAHDAMLRLSIELAMKEAAGKRLSADEQVIADITWIDVQVAPNGFDGWLYYTSNERIRRTLDALATVGCSGVAALLKKAMALAAIDPVNMSNDDRQARLDSLNERERSCLLDLDGEFCDAIRECMERCRAFVDTRKQSFPS